MTEYVNYCYIFILIWDRYGPDFDTFYECKYKQYGEYTLEEIQITETLEQAINPLKSDSIFNNDDIKYDIEGYRSLILRAKMCTGKIQILHSPVQLTREELLTIYQIRYEEGYLKHE